MLKMASLYSKGFKVASRQETEIQIKWRREDNWRAGSQPDEGLEKPEKLSAIGAKS